MKRFLSISHCIVRHYQIRISIHTAHTWHGMAKTACRFCRMNFLSLFFFYFFPSEKKDTKRKEILSKRYGAVLNAPYLDGLGVETTFDAARCTHRLEQKKRKIENENEKQARAPCEVKRPTAFSDWLSFRYDLWSVHACECECVCSS